VLTAALAVGAVAIAAVALAGSRTPAAPRFVALSPQAPPTTPPVVPHGAWKAPVHAAGQARSVDRVLRHTSYVRLGGSRRREVALTFDDGPSRYTPAILGVLRRMHAPATFFVIGRWARAFPKLVMAEVRAGCEVGDHTENHPPLALLSPIAQAAEIAAAARAIHSDGAPYPVLFRPPYGSFDPSTLQVLRAQRMLMVLWSADTEDYRRLGVAKIVYTALSGARPGEIILMHDGGGDRAQTVAALPRIIARLHQRGFRLVTVSQLLADDPPPRNQPPPHPLSGVL
jgi:peptidoglycan-N-acetylglucosamine deacetylase